MSDLRNDTPRGPRPGHPEHPDTGSHVDITVNAVPYTVHRGHTTVVELKRIASVPPAHELEQIEAGQMRPLPDDGAVTLKGREQFVSHPRDSASS